MRVLIRDMSKSVRLLVFLVVVLMGLPCVQHAYATEGSELVATSAANDWQIVSGGYQGNDASFKTVSDDGMVKIQKNVVPTDVENEFLVYVSVDKAASMKELFDASRFYVTTSNKYHSYVPGSVVGNVVGNDGGINPSGDGGRDYLVTLNVHQSIGSPVLYSYRDWRSGTVPNASNGTGFFRLPGMSEGSWAIASQSASLKRKNSELVFDIYLDQVDVRWRYEVGFNLNGYVDVMGDNMDFEGVVYSDGDANFDEGSRTLTWSPVMKEDAAAEFTTNPYEGWYHNCTELVYRVKLDVTSEGFSSGGTPSYCSDDSLSDDMLNRVNDSATLNYTKHDLYGVRPDATASVSPSNPVVRGLLYDFEFMKTDENGAPLGGATFQLTDAEGTPLTGADVAPITAVSASDGSVKFHDLPWGTYGAVETAAPAGYRIDEQARTVPAAVLCWTTSSSTLVEDHTGQHAADWRTDADNAAPSRSLSAIRNLPNLCLDLYKHVVRGSDSTPLAGARFTLTRTDGNTTIYRDEACTQELGEGFVETDATGNALFYGLGVGEYTIEEVWAPTGYSLLEKPLRMKVERVDDSDSAAPVFQASLYSEEAGEWIPATIVDGVIKGGMANVSNEPIGELPATGVGTRPLMLIGALACIGLSVWAARRLRADES